MHAKSSSGGGGGPSGGGPSGAGGGDERLTSAFWRSRAPKRPTGNGKLADRFGTVPFDVIDAKKGPHQARKKQWHAIIDDGGRGGSTLGRKDNLIGAGYAALGGGRAGQANAGTSEYDPVVGEFAHRFAKRIRRLTDEFCGRVWLADDMCGVLAEALRGLGYSKLGPRKQLEQLLLEMRAPPEEPGRVDGAPIIEDLGAGESPSAEVDDDE